MGSRSPITRSVTSSDSGVSIGRALCSVAISAPAFSRARRRRISSIAPVAIAIIIAAARWRQGLCTFPKKSQEQRPLSRLPEPTRTTRRGSPSTA